MIFETPVWIDVTPFLLTRQQPVFTIPRDPAHTGQKAWAGPSQVGTLGDYWVFQGNLIHGDALEVFPVRSGDAVRVPLWAYNTSHRSLPAILSLGVQIGLAAMCRLRNYTSEVPKAVHMVVGSECTDLAPAEEGFRCYVGVAVRTK